MNTFLSSVQMKGTAPIPLMSRSLTRGSLPSGFNMALVTSLPKVLFDLDVSKGLLSYLSVLPKLVALEAFDIFKLFHFANRTTT